MRLTVEEKRGGSPASKGDLTLATYLKLVEEVEDVFESASGGPLSKGGVGGVDELKRLFHLLDRKVEALLFRWKPWLGPLEDARGRKFRTPFRNGKKS